MRLELAYGRHGLSVDVPENAHIVASRVVPGLPDESEALRQAMGQPIGSAPLASKVKAGDTVVVTHSDITPATPNDRILPILVAELEAAGVRREDIILLNALGTHRPQTARAVFMSGDVDTNTLPGRCAVIRSYYDNERREGWRGFRRRVCIISRSWGRIGRG